MNPDALVGVFSTVAGVLVTIRSDGDGYITACGGCDWVEKSGDVTRPGEIAARLTNPLTAMRARANAHALGCAEVPRSQWPGADTDGW